MKLNPLTSSLRSKLDPQIKNRLQSCQALSEEKKFSKKYRGETGHFTHPLNWPPFSQNYPPSTGDARLKFDPPVLKFCPTVPDGLEVRCHLNSMGTAIISHPPVTVRCRRGHNHAIALLRNLKNVDEKNIVRTPKLLGGLTDARASDVATCWCTHVKPSFTARPTW